jgi:polysaccharide export outer membrane protein
MKGKANHAIMVGSILIAICGSLLGQAPATGDAAPGAASAVAMAPPPPPSAPSAIKPNDSEYVIGNDDLLSINVWKEAEVSRSLPVRSDGKISLPMVGEVQAAGQTPLQLEVEIANKLQSYITDPVVTVMVQESNSQRYNILGQVAKPGSYSLALTTSVIDAIATAGGFRDFAKKKGIYILRRTSAGGETRIPFNYTDVIKGKRPEQNIRLQPNDTVVVP